MLREYYIILCSIFIVVLISVILVYLSFFVNVTKEDSEKISPYECGFDPFEDARNTFDVKFYLVAILFIVFDLEIIFLFPWAVSLNTINLFGFWSMVAFLIILAIGFTYEWQKGAIDWN